MHGQRTQRWLFIGHLAKGQTSLMRKRALQLNGLDVYGFDTRVRWDRQSWLQRQLSIRTEAGRVVNDINESIIQTARELKPTHVWFDKQEYVWPETMAQLTKLGAFVIYYTPDPYFSLAWKRTKLMDACLPLFDLLITSKSYELPSFGTVGRPCLYLPLGYCEETHRPRSVAPTEKVDVGFIGCWEPRRQRMMEALVRVRLSVRLWGYSWDHLIDGKWTLRRWMRLQRLAGGDDFSISKCGMLATDITPNEVFAEDYALAVSSCNMNLGFLRKICPDQHTTRSFEIPACGSMMLADRTDEHRELFEEGKEAEYFSSDEELLEKAHFYSRNEIARCRIAVKGYQRCTTSGYSYRNRMQKVLNHLNDQLA